MTCSFSLFGSDFSTWVDGIVEELSTLDEEIHACTGSTTTAFRSEEDIRECDCDRIGYVLPTPEQSINLSIDQLSKYEIGRAHV